MVRRLNEYIDNNDLWEEEVIDQLESLYGFKKEKLHYTRDLGNGFTAYADTDDYTGWIDFDNHKGVAHDVSRVYDLGSKREFDEFVDLCVRCARNDAPELVEELLREEGFDSLNDEVMVQDFGKFSASYFINKGFGYCSRNDKRNADNIEKEFGILAFVNMYCEWLKFTQTWEI